AGSGICVCRPTCADRHPPLASASVLCADAWSALALDRSLRFEAQTGAAVDHGRAAAGDLGIDAVTVVEDRADEGISAGGHRASCILWRCSCTVRTKAFVSASSPSARTERRSW